MAYFAAAVKAVRIVVGKKCHRRPTGSMLAEFAPCLMILFMFIFFPLINLMGLATGCASIMLLTNQAAQSAATEQTYGDSLDTMYQNTSNFLGSGFAKFCGAHAVGGYKGCGVDLYTQSTKLSGTTSMIGPNSPLPPPVDTTDNVYEYVVTAHYTMTPIVSMEKIPVLGNIPGLGPPANFSFSATRLVEHPQGLAGNANANTAPGPGSLGLFDRSLIGTTAPSGQTAQAAPAYNFGTWRDPSIFQQIAAAGQTVVAINVVQVNANCGPASSGWVSSGLVVQPGQNCWLDTRADGMWFNGGTTTDANGTSGMTQSADFITGDIDSDFPNSMLIGYAGNPPQLGFGHMNKAVSGDPHFIPSGNTLLNFPLKYSGPIWLAMNDNELIDSGFQTVRVIITQ